MPKRKKEDYWLHTGGLAQHRCLCVAWKHKGTRKQGKTGRYHDGRPEGNAERPGDGVVGREGERQKPEAGARRCGTAANFGVAGQESG